MGVVNIQEFVSNSYSNVFLVDTPRGIFVNDSLDHFYNVPEGIRYLIEKKTVFENICDLQLKLPFNNSKYVILLYYVVLNTDNEKISTRYFIKKAERLSVQEKLKLLLKKRLSVPEKLKLLLKKSCM